MLIRFGKRKGEKRLLPRILLCTVLLGFSATTAFAAQSFIETNVICGGETYKVSSISADPESIISLADITVDEDDKVILKDFVAGKNGSVIEVVKNYNVTVEDKKKRKSVLVGGKVSNALKKAKIKLSEYDSTYPKKSEYLTEGMSVKILRAFDVKIEADGEIKTYKAASDLKVKELLKREGYTLGEYDKLNVKKNSFVEKGQTVKITRVTYEAYSVKRTVNYETKTEYDDKMFVGESVIKQKGQRGSATDFYFKKYVDGRKTDEIYALTVNTENKVDEIIVCGTKKRPNAVTAGHVISELTPTVNIELDENGKPKKYKKLIVGKAAAYCGGGITSTGQRAMPGRVAVNPRQIPYGTKMYIVSSDGRYCYGYAEASDTGGFARKGSATVDLYMHSYYDCMQFGRRSVEIYILE